MLIIDTDLIEHDSIMCLSLKATIAKRWTGGGGGGMVKFVGQPAFDVVYGMEKSSLDPAFGVFKECEGLMPTSWAIWYCVVHVRQQEYYLGNQT